VTLDEVCGNLCVYDARNTDYDFLDDEHPCTPCYCDNCIYGRNKLALEILRLRGMSGKFVARASDETR